MAANKLLSTWFDPAAAVTYLLKGFVPATIDWWALLKANDERQRLNEAIQHDKIKVKVVRFDGTSSELTSEEKTLITLRFRQMAFLGGGIGVVAEVINGHTGEIRRDIKTLMIDAEDVRVLGTITTGALKATEVPDQRSDETSKSVTNSTEAPENGSSPIRAPTKRWIAAEVRRLKAANEIQPNIRITEFAKVLERRMRKAAKADDSLRPVAWRHIKNMLPKWGLWPINSI